MTCIHVGPDIVEFETEKIVSVVCALGYERAKSVGDILMSLVGKIKKRCYKTCSK